MRTCTSSHRCCWWTSSPSWCCRSAPRRWSPTPTRTQTCSAPTACTGWPTPAPTSRWTCSSCARPACRRRGSSRRGVLGLAEMMNFPGVIAGDPDELAKLGLEGAEHVDGHAPGVLGRRLQAYAAAGIGSDHEATTPQEGRERLRAGMWLLIREASGARNLDALLPLVHEFGPARMAFCTDDREPGHIARDGHVNSMVRRAVEAGVDARDALAMASS